MGKPKKVRLPDFGGLFIPELAFLLAGRNRGAKWAPGAYEDADEAWEAHREELIAFWTSPRMAGKTIPLQMKGSPELHVRGPGCRPFYWWHTEAREPRRIVLDDGRTVPIFARTWAQGLEGDWDGTRGRFAFGIPTSHPPGLKLESERTYLARLGLLEKDETPGGETGTNVEEL